MISRAVSSSARVVLTALDARADGRADASYPWEEDVSSPCENERQLARASTSSALEGRARAHVWDENYCPGVPREARSKTPKSRGERRAALSPLGTNGTPLRRARSLVARELGVGFGGANKGEDGLLCRAPSDAASAVVDSPERGEAATREREALVAFARELARAADQAVAERDAVRADLEDALAALAAFEDERQREIVDAEARRVSELEAWEFSLLFEAKAKTRESERARSLAIAVEERDRTIEEKDRTIQEKDREIRELRSNLTRETKQPSRAASYAVANLRDEVKAILRAEIERDIREEIDAKAT